LYAEEPFGVDLAETVYAFDATTIDLCLSIFPWAPFRSLRHRSDYFRHCQIAMNPAAHTPRPTVHNRWQR
jgi:hypothetical protein